jgi:hypothetical protein
MGVTGVQRGQTATITSGESVSDEVDLFSLQLVGFDMPALWTAADIAFKVAEVGDAFSGDHTYRDLVFGGAVYYIPAAAGQAVRFDADTIARFQGVRHLKIVSWDSSGGAAVNQGADRVIVPIVGQTLN